MNNYVHSGKTMEFTAPVGGVVSGQPYKVGDTVGIVVADAAEGETAVMNLVGVHTVDKASGVAFTQGARVYWDNSAENFTTTSGGNTLVGVSEETLATGTTSAKVRWNGSF